MVVYGFDIIIVLLRRLIWPTKTHHIMKLIVKNAYLRMIDMISQNKTNNQNNRQQAMYLRNVLKKDGEASKTGK